MKLDNYHELCLQLANHGYTDPHLTEDLRIDMQDGKSLIELMPRGGGFRINDDQVNYLLTVTRYGHRYVWDATAMVLHRNLPIRHGTFNGINTSELEQRMKPIDWMVDYGKIKGKANPNHSKVPPILNDLLTLQKTGGERGIEIGLQLIQRYLLPGPNGADQGLHSSLLQLSPPLSHLFDMTAQPFTFKEAYSLLSSRAVRKKAKGPVQGSDFQWFRLNLDDRGRGDPRELLQYPDFDLLPQLAKLPCPESCGQSLHQSKRILQAGDLLYLTSQTGLIKVTVDPAQQIVYGLDDYMEPINQAALLRKFHPTSVSLEQQARPDCRIVRPPRKFKGIAMRNPFAKRGRPLK